MMRTLITIAFALGCATPAMADLALAKSRSCLACHSVDKKLVGPAFKDVALRYAGQNNAPQLASKIMKGGGGVWGPVPMPANNQVSEAEAQKLAEWILSLK